MTQRLLSVDGALEADVASALWRQFDVPSTVRAAVLHRRVTLSGSVHWQHQREAAARAAGAVDGVRAVINRLALNPTSVAAGLEASVRNGLVRDAQREGAHVHVRRDTEGAVHVTGDARCWSEVRQIEQICRSAAGVTAVTQQLRVQVQGDGDPL